MRLLIIECLSPSSCGKSARDREKPPVGAFDWVGDEPNMLLELDAILFINNSSGENEKKIRRKRARARAG
jgi:hypothetical protein